MFGCQSMDIKAINTMMRSCSNLGFIVIHLDCLFENTNLYFSPLREKLFVQEKFWDQVSESESRMDFVKKIIFEKSVKLGDLICVKNIGRGNFCVR